MMMPSDDRVSKGDSGAARRIEILTGAGRQREWSAQQKAVIVAESYAGRSSVWEVARRHALTPTQLFAWRRAARCEHVAKVGASREFVSAILEGSRDTDLVRQEQRPTDATPLIGFDLNGANVWVCAGADAGVVNAIIRALNASVRMDPGARFG